VGGQGEGQREGTIRLTGRGRDLKVLEKIGSRGLVGEDFPAE
jgi:hypothetical protein